MRSRAVATILSEIGWRVGVLAGGYRTWRRAVVADLRDSDAPLNLILVDGQTGTAKSRIIQRLAEIGAQTLDLEAAAAHRGSVFGATAAAQPSQKFFESMLFAALSRIDPARPIIVEAESNRIGRLVVPKRIWRAMNASPRVEITAPPEARARYLVTAYAELLHDCTTVVAAIDRLAPFHSKETVESWRELARQGAFEALALDLMRKHYDPRYDRSRKLRADRPLIEVRLERLDEEAVDAAAEHLAEFAVKTLEPAGCRAG
jgi:tRNA 2-selenouridine synthase